MHEKERQALAGGLDALVADAGSVVGFDAADGFRAGDGEADQLRALVARVGARATLQGGVIAGAA